MKYVYIWFTIEPFTDELLNGIHLQPVRLEIPDEYDQARFDEEWKRLARDICTGVSQPPKIREE